jgi:sensor domain CHASE-containing protein
VLARLQPFGRALSLAIDQRSAVLVGMRALIEVRWNAPEFDRDFDAFTADVERTTPGIRTLQYVVNGVIQRTSPRGSNDQAVGLDLYRHPDPQVPRDLHQAEQSDGVVLSGPFDLAQGGRGLVARLAARDSAGRLLCVVAAVLDLGPLLAEAQIDAAPGLALVLVNESGRVLGGTAAVLTDRPAVVEVPLPDRRWQLAARPSGGWGSESKVRLFWFHARVLLLSVLLSAIAGLLAARQAGRRREREVPRASTSWCPTAWCSRGWATRPSSRSMRPLSPSPATRARS